MTTANCLSSLLLLTVVLTLSLAQFEVPVARVEPLSPRGFRVSIPDVEGIKLFAFHGKLNEEFEGQEGGTYSKDILRVRDGRWTFTDKETKLKAGDVLYYWLYVDWNDGVRTLGYTRHWQEFKVTDLVPSPDTQSCNIKSGTTFNGKTICGGIAFKDDFELNKINEASWTVEQYIPTFKEPGFEFCSYQNRPDNVFINDGNLFLKPIARTRDEEVRGTLDLTDKCTSDLVRQDCYYVQKSAYIIPPTSSGQITSNFTLKYGRIDVKAKLSRGDWIFSELALIPVGSDPKEKVVFALSRGNLDLKTINTGTDIGLGVLYAEVSLNDLMYLTNTTSETFYTNIAHTYSIDWTPGSIKFLVDDVEFGSVNSNSFDNEARLRISTGVGGFKQFPEGLISGKNEKPWKNNDRKSLVKFFDSRNEWLPSWKGNDVAIKIDSVTVTAK